MELNPVPSKWYHKEDSEFGEEMPRLQGTSDMFCTFVSSVTAWLERVAFVAKMAERYAISKAIWAI